MYQFRDKKQIAKKAEATRKLGIVISVVVLFSLGIFSYTSGFLYRIASPFWKMENKVDNTISNSAYLVRTKHSVFNENENLKKENEDLKIKMTDYNLLKEDNEKIKDLLGRLPAKHSFVLGNILVKPNRSPYDTIIVDAGSLLGIKEGMQVFANATIPIGLVSNVYEHNSLITLYSSPDEVTEAQISTSNATVELTGRGGGNFEMEIQNEMSADRGASVILPGNENMIVAIVEDTISKPNDPLKKVLLRSPVNIQELKWVEIKKD